MLTLSKPRPIRVTAHTPESKGAQAIDFSKERLMIHFATSSIRAYCLMMIEWQRCQEIPMQLQEMNSLLNWQKAV
jgi:hypothetical protein